MGSRAYIAKFEPDGAGQFIYLGHGCYPDDVGLILLQHYQDESAVDATINLGAMCFIVPSLLESVAYHRDHREPWERCQPVAISGGAEAFFSKAYQLGPEWLYAWTVVKKVDFSSKTKIRLF